MTGTNRPLDPRVLPHLRPARVPLAVVATGSVLGGLLVVGQAFAVAALVVTLVQGGDWRAAVAWFLAVTLARAGTGWLLDTAAARAAGRVGRHLRHVVLRSALDLPATDLATRRTGELSLLATRGVAAVEPYLTRYLPSLVLATVLPVLVLLAIAALDWLSALIVALTLPLVPVFAVLIGLATREKADRQWRLLSQLSGHFLDVVKGLPTLVAHRRAAAQAPRIRAITDRYRRASAETLRLAFASSAALELVATISVALVAVSVGLRLADGDLGLQTALTVLLLAPEAYWPLRRVGAEYHAAAEGTATFEAITAMTAATTPAPACGGPSRAGGLRAAVSPQPIELAGLGASWPGRSAPALRDLHATIPAGGITAITGPSGCGKSTLLQVLLAELPYDGWVRVGGAELRDLGADEWRASVAHVGQRPWVLPGTVAENLRIGRPGATDAEVWAALAAVGLRELVAALPGGLEAWLGEDGAGLSAGQRARLALARVLLSGRPYVLLDEPTAHLDEDTEAVLLETLRTLARTSTVVVVAHRDAVIAAADRVIALPGRTAPTDRVRPDPGVTGDGPPASTDGAAASRTPNPRPETGSGASGERLRSASVRLRSTLAVLLSTLASASGLALTATAGWLIVRAAAHPPVLVLMVAIVGVRLFGLARPVLRYAERLVSHDVALRLLAERRAAVYDLLVPLVPGRIGGRGEVLASVVDDVDALVDERLRVRLPLRTWLGVTGLAALAVLFLSPAAAGVVVAVGLAGGSAAYLVARLGGQRAEPAYVAARAQVSARTVDLLTSARQLMLWRHDDTGLARVDAAGHRMAVAAAASARATASGRAGALLAAGLGVAAMAAVVAPGLASGAASGPVAALLVLIPLALGDLLAPLADAGALRVRTRAAEDRLEELAGTEPALVDPDRPSPLPNPAPDGPAPHIRLDRVAAAWTGPTVVRDLDLDLPPGAHVGLVGPSGSGKSTVAALLMRFLAPADGSHTVDAVETRQLTADDVRRLVGLIDDDPYVFGSSLLENVRLARPTATDADVESAVRAAHLGQWLDTLPDGLDSRLGDGGADVSGGERARIGIARALLADPTVLVLDEPTAHLDGETAARVAADLLAASRGRSLVWITHDQVALDRMDAVVRLG